MTGEVYDIPIQGQTQNLPHPQVVVLELDKECWLVPAFTSGGHELEKRTADFVAAGYPAGHISVELDNAEHVVWIDSRPSHRACWVVARVRKLPKHYIRRFKKSGRMSAEGVRKIGEAILVLAEVRGELFSAHFVKRLRTLVAGLKTAD